MSLYAPNGTGFQSVVDFKEVLSGRVDQFSHCLTEKMLAYSMGRTLEFTDRPEVDKIVDDKALVTFDLALPFKSQLSRAGKLLKVWQDDLRTQGRLTLMFPKNYVANWRTYLRVLDADAAGVSKMEIAEAVGFSEGFEYPDRPPSTKVGETLVLADRLVQGGYRKILFMDK